MFFDLLVYLGCSIFNGDVISQSVLWWATVWPTGVIFPVGQGFSLLYSVQTESGAHLTLYTTVPGVLSPGVKRPGREADHSPLSSAEVKNGGAIPPLPHMSS
jgi:hypothetical protein